MDQRVFTIIFIVFLVVAVGGLGYSKLQESTNPKPSPSPSAEGLIFDQQKQQANKMQNQKQIKQYKAFPGELPASQLTNKKAIIETSKGVIEFEIYPEASKAASNFVFLANDKFFDGIIFHRVEGWVIQAGDPTGTGRGGPGYRFEDEPVTREYMRGTVAMANAGPNTNGSQFFILKKDTPLPPSYTIFGDVLKGLEVVDKIQVGDLMKSVSIQNLK